MGKVVAVVWAGICASGDALQVLGPLQPPNVQGQSYGSAYRAVRIGKARLYGVYACSEACPKPFNAEITVTNGCEILSRKAVIARLSRGGPDWTWSAKLIPATQYEQLFDQPLNFAPLNFAPDELVWAVLGTGPTISGTYVDPTPGPIGWAASAMDACTDYVSGYWKAASMPAGWSSLTDQSTT